MALHTGDYNKNKVTEFTNIVKGFINTSIVFIPFDFGNMRILIFNGKFIFLWQNAKGDIYYKFSLFEKEYYTTTATKLGNILTQHLEVKFKVVNNSNERLKDMIRASTGLNKALEDSNRQNYVTNNYQQKQVPSLTNGVVTAKVAANELLEILDSKDTTSQTQAYEAQLNQQYDSHNEEQLHKGIIQLSSYYLEAHINTRYINLDEIPIAIKERFAPSTKQSFISNSNGLSDKNKFIPTPWMVYPYYLGEANQSFILLYILFMAKNDVHQALRILVWIADCLTSLNKLPFALVLHAKNDVYMKLFYEEILEPLFHDFQCVKIVNDSLDEKSLSVDLDEKAIYNFHNITMPAILGEPAHELTNRLIHKDSYKINRENVTTVANSLITSTSKYAPMTAKDVPSVIVEIDSNIDDLCKYLKIRPNKQTLATYIKNDFPNFIGIIRALDIQMLNSKYPILDDSINSNLLNSDTDITEVFDNLIRDNDTVPFESMITNAKSKKLVQELKDNFNLKRVDKAHLLDYFELLFGKGIYRSNKALINALRKDYSTTGEPFENIKTHVRKGRAYYFL